MILKQHTCFINLHYKNISIAAIPFNRAFRIARSMSWDMFVSSSSLYIEI